MTVTQADRIFRTVLRVDRAMQWWTVDDIEEVLADDFDDDELPSRRTVRGRLEGLESVGVLIQLGGGGRTYNRYKIRDPIPEFA